MRIPWFILVIIPSLLGLTYVWWRWADARVRLLPHASWWRAAVGAFVLAFAVGVASFIASRAFGWHWRPPTWWVAGVMLWGLLALPLLAVPLMTASALRPLVRAFRPRQPIQKPDTVRAATDRLVTRRQVLGAAVALAPMVLTLGSSAFSVVQNRRLRIRRLLVELPQLPAALDGMTIAHVSDTHVGRFTYGELLKPIVDATNSLDADLVLFTGDLIDSGVHELPEALEMVRGIRQRERLFLVEGNHDLFNGREPFASALRSADLSLLLDEAATIRIKGQPVQVLGATWHGRPAAVAGSVEANVDRVAVLRDPDAFPILLAHHPHAFDRAATHGIPLTLAGHTHGGQLMLGPEVGAGPLFFRYWSGLYRQHDSRLVVSNGAGNWFPLRTHAPAEIVHLTLRRT
jgi:uncharacterized protein